MTHPYYAEKDESLVGTVLLMFLAFIMIFWSKIAEWCFTQAGPLGVLFGVIACIGVAFIAMFFISGFGHLLRDIGVLKKPPESSAAIHEPPYP